MWPGGGRNRQTPGAAPERFRDDGQALRLMLARQMEKLPDQK